MSARELRSRLRRERDAPGLEEEEKERGWSEGEGLLDVLLLLPGKGRYGMWRRPVSLNMAAPAERERVCSKLGTVWRWK